jgi:hypothetical protein
MRISAILAILVLAGCSNTTETGYKPTKLGDTLIIQRGYYAPAFSPEQREAQQELRTGSDPRSVPDIRNF